MIRNQPGNTLTEILETPATEQQEAAHAADVESRAGPAPRTPEEMEGGQSVMEDAQLPLEQKKRKIQRNLRTLEQMGHVSSKNKYQEILSEIAKDIRNQRIYRKLRKAELAKLQQTLKALNEKAAFYEEQINYYDTYIKTCLDNLKIKNSRRSIKIDDKGEGGRGKELARLTQTEREAQRTRWACPLSTVNSHHEHTKGDADLGPGLTSCVGWVASPVTRRGGTLATKGSFQLCNSRLL